MWSFSVPAAPVVALVRARLRRVLRPDASRKPSRRGVTRLPRRAALRPVSATTVKAVGNGIRTIRSNGAAVKALLVRRCVFNRHQHRATPFAAETETLDQAAGDQQDRRPYAERVIGRQQPDRRGRNAHDEQRQIEHRLAADLVAEMTEHDAAERPRNEPQCIGAERQQRPHRGIECGKEQFVEDERRGGAVKEEIVPLDGGVDEAGCRYRDVRRWRPCCFQRDGHVPSRFSYRSPTNIRKTIRTFYKARNLRYVLPDPIAAVGGFYACFFL